MKITDEGVMRVRHHQGFGHGLEPGTDRDINCPSCKREDTVLTETDIRQARTDPRGECTCTFEPYKAGTFTRPVTDRHCPVHAERPASLVPAREYELGYDAERELQDWMNELRRKARSHGPA